MLLSQAKAPRLPLLTSRCIWTQVLSIRFSSLLVFIIFLFVYLFICLCFLYFIFPVFLISFFFLFWLWSICFFVFLLLFFCLTPNTHFFEFELRKMMYMHTGALQSANRVDTNAVVVAVSEPEPTYINTLRRRTGTYIYLYTFIYIKAISTCLAWFAPCGLYGVKYIGLVSLGATRLVELNFLHCASFFSKWLASKI